MMKIRQANMKDIEGIAKVHVDSWRTTYAEIIPVDFLNGLTYEARQDLWRKNLLQADNYVLVAEDASGQIIGFADTSKRASNEEENTTDLTSIYLSESTQGQGVGKLLLQRLFEYYEQQGYSKVYVDLLADNKTRFFYEYYGAKFVKSIQISIGGKIVDEYVYVWTDISDVLKKITKKL